MGCLFITEMHVSANDIFHRNEKYTQYLSFRKRISGQKDLNNRKLLAIEAREAVVYLPEDED